MIQQKNLLLTAPVKDLDAATKKYVDDNAGGGIITAVTSPLSITAKNLSMPAATDSVPGHMTAAAHTALTAATTAITAINAGKLTEDVITAAGAVSLTAATTFVEPANLAADMAITLAAGVKGQRKLIFLNTTMTAPHVVTFGPWSGTTAGDLLDLVYTGAAWTPIVAKQT